VADTELAVKITARTDEFVKSVKDIHSRCSQIAQEIREIDKQLKDENVDKVAKLGEKLELVKRQSALAAKEAAKYAEQIKELNDSGKKGAELTEDQKKKLENLTERYSLAQQKAQTYKASVETVTRELDRASRASEELADCTGEAAAGVEDIGKASDSTSESIKSFIKWYKGNTIISIATKGLSAIVSALKSIASAAYEAAKAVVTFAKNYADGAVELAASYADAASYSEQIFGDNVESVQKWVKGNSAALRVGETSLIQYVNKFGSLFRTFGFGVEESTKRAEELTRLAVDIRAATGDSLEQVMQSLTAGLTGGYKAFQRYGVVVTEAGIKAKALAMGLVDVKVNQTAVAEASNKLVIAQRDASKALSKYGEDSIEYETAQVKLAKAEENLGEALGGKALALDDVSKKMATMAILTESLAFIDGQAAKESASYQSQLSLKETLFENLQKSIGDKLLPVYNQLITKFNEFMQSDTAQRAIQALTNAVGLLADEITAFIESEKFTNWVTIVSRKIETFVASGSLENWVNDFLDKMPAVIETLESLATVAEKALKPIVAIGQAMKNKDDFNELDKALKNTRDTMHEFCESTGIEYSALITNLNNFAKQNGASVTEVLNSWQTHAPEIQTYMQGVEDKAAEMNSKVTSEINGAEDAFTGSLSTMASTDTSGFSRIASAAENAAARIKSAWQSVQGWLSSLGGLNLPGRASGGSVMAGQAYMVGETGRELFVPAVNGTILNAAQTERVINNHTSNKTYGDLIVNVTSYGTDAASIADEIGAAVNRRLRMSGGAYG